MIVGEPSLMGGEMEDEDERYITRLENVHYEPNSTSAFLSSKPPGFVNVNQIKSEPTSYSPSNGTIRPTMTSNDDDSSTHPCNGSNLGGEKSPPVTPQSLIPS